MTFISDANSFTPCLDSSDIFLAATEEFKSIKDPLYTTPICRMSQFIIWELLMRSSPWEFFNNIIIKSLNIIIITLIPLPRDKQNQYKKKKKKKKIQQY